MSMAFRFSILTPDQLPAVQHLMRTVFQKRVTVGYLQSKYDTRYTGRNHVAMLAYQGQEPVGFYGALPQIFLHQGKKILAAQTCDSYVARAHQGQGLHKELALRCYDHLQEQGIQFVYALHSQATLHSCKKLDWQLGPTMRGHWLRTGNLPWGKWTDRIPSQAIQRNRRARRAEILKPFQIPGSEFENSNTGLELHQLYDEAYFRYKCFTENYLIQIGQVRFWIRIQAGFWIGDLAFESPDELPTALDQLRRLAGRMGYRDILFQTHPGNPAHAWLEHHLESFDSWPLGYRDFSSGADFSQFAINFGDLDTF